MRIVVRREVGRLCRVVTVPFFAVFIIREADFAFVEVLSEWD